MDDIRIPFQRLLDFVETILHQAGVRSDVATTTARGLCDASLRGVDSHGVRLLPHYVGAVRGGRVNPNPNFQLRGSAAGTAVLDADHGFGHAAGMQAMREAMRLAADAGLGAVAVGNSSHCGALAFFTNAAASEGYLGFATTHATARLQTPNAALPFFGNNPIACSAPMQDEGPFCFDSALSGITFNEVRRRQALGEPLPPGLVADEAGEPTLSPAAAAQLVPIGQYKGFGLAMVMDILCALLTGMPAGKDVSVMFDGVLKDHRNLGHFFMALRIDAFVEPVVFRRRLQQMAGDIRGLPSLTGTPVMIPGDPEKASAAQRRRLGIPLAPVDIEEFNKLATEFAVGGIA